MTTTSALHGHRPFHWATLTDAIWSFVYVFFSNGVPFDAPNRSEPCLRSS